MARLVQWFGANTENAEMVGKILGDCRFVGVPFAGGMSEVPFIKAKQILVNDLHRHIINLCRVVADDASRKWLIEQATALPYHPDVLAKAQDVAWLASVTTPWTDADSRWAALWYFVCVWMGRGGKAGTDGEFSGALPIRWNANGGGSNRRYRTAIEGLDAWGKAFRRCEFVCMDAFEFLAKFQDNANHGLYVDAPWPDLGDGYVHKFTEGDQLNLRNCLDRFEGAKVVARFGEHPLIRELYHEWHWIPMESRTQTNERKAEFLICNFQPEE